MMAGTNIMRKRKKMKNKFLVVKKNILTLITVSPYITASNETEILTERKSNEVTNKETSR